MWRFPLSFSLLLLVSCAQPVTSAPVVTCPSTLPEPIPSTEVVSSVETEKLSPEKALERLLTASSVHPEWFAEAFLRQVPIAQVTHIVQQFQKDLGTLEKVEKEGAGYRVIWEKGTVPSRLHLDKEGRIDGLFFSPPELAKPRALSEILDEMKTLPGKVSVLVMTSGKSEGEIAPDAELAVGSAFKLAILAALKERIEAKKMTWTQVVQLNKKYKSLPSGILQNWPENSPLTLHSVASLMISQSDNTATDLAFDLVGRAAVEKFFPGNAPLLNTREAFTLKSKKNVGLLEKWRTADEAGRRKMLPDIDATPLPTLEELPGNEMMAPDIEWRANTRQLCGLLAKTKDLSVFQINPGVASKKDWDAIAFKGGSEPGVLNLSAIVEKEGKQHCVIATWNDDKPVDEARFFLLYQAILASLRGV